MGPPLLDDIWTRRGISLLWDAETLARLCTPSQVISLRQFLQLHAAGWPEDRLAFVNEKALVVGGLESCIDALPPTEAMEWLEQSVYQTLISYEREVAHGGTEAALILWLADHRRLHYQTSDDIHYWHCSTEHKDQQIPLSLCLFDGAQNSLRAIHVVNDQKAERTVGLFHPRISA